MVRWRLWFFVPLLAVLAACGSTPVQPGASNTSPGTTTPGPIVIATDHAAYAPTDRLQITLTNELVSPIYAADHQASCSVFSLQHMVNGTWQEITKPLAGCPQGRPTMLVKLMPGTPYHATIIAGYLRQGESGFPAGQYRMVFSYSTTSPDAKGGTPAATTVYSATLTVDPNIPPELLPTQVPGNGTPTSGTIVPIGTTKP